MAADKTHLDCDAIQGGSSLPTDTTYTDERGRKIRSAFCLYPGGGDRLSKALAGIIEADKAPVDATHVLIEIARDGTLEQQKAVGMALADFVQTLSTKADEVDSASAILGWIEYRGSSEIKRGFELNRGFYSATAAAREPTFGVHPCNAGGALKDLPTPDSTRNEPQVEHPSYSDCYGGSSQTKPVMITRNIYEFLPTQREVHSYEIEFPASGLVAYMLLTRPEDRERNAEFVTAFFSVVSDISKLSEEGPTRFSPDTTYNMFLFPVKSYRLVTTRILTSSNSIEDMRAAIFDSDYGYDYAWAASALDQFCSLFTEISATPPCRSNLLRGPFVVVTNQIPHQPRGRRILLVDLSTRENLATFREDLENLVSDNPNEFKTSGSEIAGSSYVTGSASTSALDLFLTASKITDDVVVGLPKDWYAPLR